LRATVDQAGDFEIIGNSLAYDCGNVGAAPVVGTVPALGCGGFEFDTAPDVFWQSDDDNNTAAASIAFFPLDARSTAVLNLPAGATVTHAFLYWAGEVAGDQGTQTPAPDDTVTFDRPDGAGGVVFTADITADTMYAEALQTNSDLAAPYDFYQQGVADVSALVNQHGEGAYRVSDFDLWDVYGENQEVSFAGWTLVVFYEDPAAPPRNLTLFDGFTLVDEFSSAPATLTGFLVPNSGFDAKLGVIAYEGDEYFSGDRLLFGSGTLDFNADALSNGLNPIDNFFNSTRTTFGAADSVSGDLPQLAGTADTTGGLDFDVIDITSRVSAGQTSANIEASTTDDVFFLGAFVTSISTFEPNLSTSTKDVTDVNGAPLTPGEELEYTITVVNNGNDNAIDTVLTDELPVGVTYVPGSLEIVSGPNQGALTDADDGDQGEYDGGTRTVTVRLGDGANAANGGTLDIGETTVVAFRVTVDANTMGTISNQGEITYAGEQGAPTATVVTDGNGPDVGTPPTDIDVQECEEDVDCGGANNGQVCDTDNGFVCVPGCRGTGNESGCPVGDICTSMDDTIGDCVPDNGGTGGAGGSTGSMSTGSMTTSGAGGMTGSMSAGVGGATTGPTGSTASGSGGGNGADGDDIDETGSCGCRIPGEPKETPWKGAGLLALLGLAVLRRRR
jgi:uncharacterized repeat protein (TIGR01451 family)/MYXO-CTERM domain-containing protein